MKVIYSGEVEHFIRKINSDDSGRLARTKEFFELYGFQVGPKYVKKISNNLWELRTGKIRLFLCIKGNIAFGVHILYKKSQKLPKKDIRLAIKRSEEI